MTGLKISSTLTLPPEAVTQTFGILAKRGVGKTYTASVMTEEMLKANLHVVVIDPIGVWYGLRSSADGKKEGLPIIIAGGEHADVPLTPESGELLANLIIEHRLSMVVDISLFRKNEQVKFMTAFAETLYRKNRNALHLVIDEADAFAPQRPFGNEARMLGAIEDIVRRGRARGLGVTMITQRPAVLNKNVLTQIEVLVALRLTAPIDQKAIDEWIKTNAEDGQREEFLGAISSLPIGTAYFWSPGWLKIFQKVKVRTRETLDSSSTPIAGKEVIIPKKMARVDLESLRSQLETTADKIESNDPKLLKKEIRDLKLKLSKNKPEVITKTVEVEVVPKALVTKVANYVKEIEKLTSAIDREMTRYANSKSPGIPVKSKQVVNPGPVMGGQKATLIIADEYAGGKSDVKITGGAQRMLNVLGSRYPMTFTKSQLAALAKMSPRSGTFGTYMSKLKSEQLISIDDGQISLTEAGQAHVGDVSSIPQTTEAVIDMWKNNLSGGARRMFEALVGYYPSSLSREELGNETEMSSGSGTFGTYLSMLKRNGLIVVDGSEVKASDSLFAGGE